MTSRSQALSRPGGRPRSRQKADANKPGAPVIDPDAWRSTVRLLLDCPAIGRADRIGLNKLAGWRKLGRADESWLATLAAQHLGPTRDAFGEDDDAE